MRKTLLALALLASAPAFAAHFEVGAGYSRGIVDANGTWYQTQNPYTMKTNSPTWYAGVTGHAYQYLAWHLDFVRLGTYSENSWDTSDRNFNRGVGCGQASCANFVGSGASQGIRLTAGPTFGYDGWHISVQGGPFFYRSTWTENVYSRCGTLLVTVQHMPRIQVGDVVGVSLRYRAFSINADRYMMRAPQDRFPPLIYGATTLTAGYRF